MDASVYLVDHVLAGLSLPPGGHVEPGEDPADAVRREAMEELGIEADFSITGPLPVELESADPAWLDPQFGRFFAKIRSIVS